MTSRIPPPAHRRERGRLWRMDTKFSAVRHLCRRHLDRSKNAIFTHPAGIFRSFVVIFCTMKPEFLTIVQHYLRDRKFSRFAPTCDGWTRDNSKHRASVYRRTGNKHSSEDEIANVNVLRRHRTCRGQSLTPIKLSS